MTGRKAQFGLMFMFLGCLGANAVVLVLARSEIFPDELQETLLKILSIYSVPLAAILGGIFAQQRKSSGASPGESWAALIVAAFWNLLLLWRIFAFLFSEHDSISDLTKYLESISSAASFLIVGVLAYFFGKSAHELEGTEHEPEETE
jgi:hypothetical protein